MCGRETTMKKKLTIELSEELHREFKVATAREGTTMKQVVLEAIKSFISKKQGRGKVHVGFGA